jgi:ATPase subunit of ABC transporter with duplicated ATPase domains
MQEGDRVCLIGHNGAGKTTLLRVLAGIYPASSGKVELVPKVTQARVPPGPCPKHHEHDGAQRNAGHPGHSWRTIR